MAILQYILTFLGAFLLFGCNAYAGGHYKSCQEQPDKIHARSQELQRLVKADQKDRESWDNQDSERMHAVSKRDLIRRKRVAVIFAEGCFNSAADYAAAALIFQHGDTSDHYFQAFTFANRAVALGNTKLKPLVALGIDRYLVSINHKQLFGSQYYASDATGWCFCMQQVEPSMSDIYRKKFSGSSLQDNIEHMARLNVNNNCPNVECDIELKPTPKGTIPGFW